MIKIENFEVMGWEHTIRGMRNPKNSWGNCDSWYQKCSETHCQECANGTGSGACLLRSDDNAHVYKLGKNDCELMLKLAKGGPVHAKYRRMIVVYVDITAPLYWWKEFDTYKVGTVANSCSTMHKLPEKEFSIKDFSCEHLFSETDLRIGDTVSLTTLECVINALNEYRNKYLETEDKKYWWQMIQLLPSSYNQKRTIKLNYEVLVGIYKWRKNHKLDEWREFCKWIESLPHSEIITGLSGNSVHYKYEVNGYTGEVIVDEFASDDDIRLAIMDDLYNVEFEKLEE